LFGHIVKAGPCWGLPGIIRQD